MILVLSSSVFWVVFDNKINYTSASIETSRSQAPQINGTIPNIELTEDSPPFTLNLTPYESDHNDSGANLVWYFTNENTSLYSIIGENSSDDLIIITPRPDRFGSNLVIVWLVDSDDQNASQYLWINITPVNDPPTIYDLPDLIIQYDNPYIFDYEPYVYDIETPKHELLFEVFDGYEGKYFEINNLYVIFNYSQEMVGQVVYVTISISDGETMIQDVFKIQILDDPCPPPKLVRLIPDIKLHEGTTKYILFDLDDYFKNLDNDVTYSVSGVMYIDIIINPNNTINISAPSDWIGEEIVTFHARDCVGATAEDSIVVTVLPVNDPPGPAQINKPEQGVEFDEDEIIDFEGVCDDPDLIYGDNLTFKWFSSVLGEIGQGKILKNITLPIGKHVITLEVSDNSGLKSNATTQITVLEKVGSQESKSDYYTILIFGGIGIIIIIIILVFVLFLMIKKKKQR